MPSPAPLIAQIGKIWQALLRLLGLRLGQLIRYGFTGSIASAVDFGLFAGLVRLAHWAWFPAALVSFVSAMTVGYVLSILMVFSSGVRFRKTDEFALIFAISLIGLALNQILLYLAIHLGLEAVIAKICVSPIVIGWNFLARAQYVFRPKAAPDAAREA